MSSNCQNVSKTIKRIKKKSELMYTVNGIVIGDVKVGKSNIVTRYCQNLFTEEYIPTAFSIFSKINIHLEEYDITLQLWDSAKQSKFTEIQSVYYRGALFILLVYAIDDPESFGYVRNWMKKRKHCVQSHIILVANRSDIDQSRQISRLQGQTFAAAEGIPFYQLSAKSGNNFNSLFEIINKLILKQIKISQEDEKKEELAGEQGIALEGKFPSSMNWILWFSVALLFSYIFLCSLQGDPKKQL